MSTEHAAYDFRSPDRLNPEREQALQVVAETFARRVASVLSTALRTIVLTRVVALRQQTYSEFLDAMPRPSVLPALSVGGLPGGGHLQLALGDAMSFLDRLLGGAGTGEQPDRPLTEIETGIFGMLFGQVASELSFAFGAIGDLEVRQTGVETSARFHQVARSTDTVVVVELEADVDGRVTPVVVCLTLSPLAPVLTTVGYTADEEESVRVAQARRVVRRRIEQVEIDVRVAFHEVSLTSSEVFALTVGDVVPLRHRTEEPLVVTGGGVPVARATPGSHGRRLAVQIVS